ncbi:PKD domain-containing protein [Pedobacter frigiditerrae]|uniref:PKD domain-containing protein n=1 Tax=Pedobacter frigiditerrae TaxID=2530452 RepID=A0A4R0N4C5_9SPHI|nr:PKD domain-containing protein [Pedobacter frigiditerrae]TCC93372.1 PKD domain-containing protein [Pedobacter frigiditerrae]
MSILCAVAFPVFAQLNIGTIDPGPYSPGSTIAATFTIDPATCIAQGNIFRLRLSDASGNFAPGVVIGTYNSFYSTFVNGIIPVGTPAGLGYKLRIESSSPVLTTAVSNSFVIGIGSAVEAKITSVPISAANTETFGLCAGKNNNNFALTNESTAGTIVSATITNEISGGAPTTLAFLTPNQIFTAGLAHYTLVTKALMLDGRVATKAYFIINNQTVTAFSTSGNNVVCLPQGALEFSVDYTGTAGIQKNFPGDTYVVNWGDLTTTTYTLCDIIQSGGKVSHVYTQSSCGNVFSGSSGTEYNVFAVNISVENPFCGKVGAAISSTAKVIAKPINSFTTVTPSCTNTAVTFVNTSLQGEDPNTNSPGCTPNTVFYNWFVDGVLVWANRPISDNLVYTFTTNGTHTVRLESVSSGTCDADPFEMSICIQDSPKPSFTLPSATICLGSSIIPTNTSIVDNTCSNTANYSWSVSPSTGVSYGGGTSSSSQQPEFIFGNTGVYQVTLTISTPSCGSVSTLSQRVVVNEAPTATLSPNAALCSINTYDFNPTTPGPTRTTFSGTSFELANTYTWTITGGNFAFTGGSNQNTKYPSIQFLDYATYTVSVTHTNNCGSVTVNQTISFTPAPTVNAGADQAICFNDIVNLNGSVTGTALTRVWVGGSGIFSPNRNDINATYTPSAAEKAIGQVTLTLRATTTLPAPCDVIDDNIIITIKPLVTVNSANTKSICTGTDVAYAPTSATAGATYAWTATGSANAGGFTASGSGNINDILTNSNPTSNATVTYTITPTGNGCLGVPFTFTVTITPNPIVTPTAVSLNICSGQSAAITLASNLPNTKYTWTSAATVGVLGSSTNSTPTSANTINDILVNNTTTSGTVDYTITPISDEGCPGTPVTITITVEPQPTTPDAGADENICNATSFTLKGNQPTVGTGLWTQVSPFPGVTFTNPTQFDGTANGLLPGNTYIFRWTITGAASCSPKTDDVSITINPISVGGTTAGSATVCAGINTGTITLSGQTGNVIRWESSTDGGVTYPNIINNTTTSLTYTNLTTTTYFRAIVQSGVCATAISSAAIITVNQGAVGAIAGPDQNLCSVTSTVLAGNDPLTNTGLWTIISGQTGTSFVDASKYNTAVNGLVAGQTYSFRWTISGLAPCPASSDDVIVRIDLLSDGGITTGSTAVCAGNSNGQITVSGQVGSIVRWESSTDNFVTTTIINTTLPTINYTNLSTTTQYRAIVKNGSCGEAISTVATVTVNQGAVGALAGPDQNLCNVTSTVLAGNDPLTNTGSWSLTSGQTGVTFANASQFNTAVNGLVAGQTYTFRWTVSGLAPCPASSDDVDIKIDLPSNGGMTAGNTSVCAGNSNGQITVSGHVGNIVRWESSTDNFVTTSVINTTLPSINYVNLTTTTQYRAVVKNGSCGESLSTVATVTVNQGAVGAIAGPDQDLCNVTSTILAGNDPLTNTGSWTLISGQTSVTFANASQFNSAVNGLVGGQTYIFRWTISGVAPCPASSDDVMVNNLSALQNNIISTSATTNCTGQAITLTGSLPTGGSGTYSYVWQSSPTGAAPWTTITGQTARDLNITVSANLSYQRIVSSGACSTTSNIITIIALPPIANNTIAADQTICLTTTPNTITGSQPTGGDGTSYTYSWEQSTDNGNTWSVVPGINTQTYSPPAITQTTLYRRLVASSVCAGSSQSISNLIRITVNLNARAEFTYTNDIGCNPYLIDDNNIKAIPYPAQNATYTWYANGVIIGTGLTFPGYTIATDNASVVIRLVTTSSLGCLSDEMSHTFTTRPNVTASYTQSTAQGCGPLSVTFTNTTAITAGFTFEWRIDNVLVSVTADPGTLTFQADPAGKDKVYNISLRVTTPCGSNTATSTVTVRPMPVAAFLPSTTIGCSPLAIVFKNTSPGSNTFYSYDFDDGTTSPATTSKADVSHTFITDVVRDFNVKMTATNECGTDVRSIIIRVSPNTITPALTVNGNQLRGCAPFTVDFINNTKGASQFTYTYGDGVVDIVNTLQTEVRSHTFTRAGTYTVTMVANNDCSTASSQVTIIIDPQPIVAFKANITTGCTGLAVKFTNNTVGAVSYAWDFGNGNTSRDAEPIFTFNTIGQHDVTLTAYSDRGCPTVVTIPNYITIVAPPNAAFAISPAAVTSIPNYTFKFTDESTNEPQTYKWSFGDGDISLQRDPSHTYRDTGTYLVTMRTYNEYGCVDSLQKYVQIVGVPGYVYVPNSFIPGGTSSELQTFTALGSGIKSWKMQVFNKWGQVLWETTKLNDGKPVEGWDGNYKGMPQPQGIYFWKIDVELVNGTEWKGMTFGKSVPKRTGEIYLIR